MNRRVFLFSSAAMTAAACAPMVQSRGTPGLGFSGPHLTSDAFVSIDGARLGLSHWVSDEEPWAVIAGLHGMNDYANAFHFWGEWGQARGIATYAIDQRGFGRSPERGVWGGDDLMVDDVRALCAVLRAKHPKAIIAIAGISMGGAVAIDAMASDPAPDADRTLLLSPAVWGWSEQPLPNRAMLWLSAHTIRSKVWTPPAWLTRKVRPTDNIDELYRMGTDRQMIWGARSDTLYGLVDMMDRGQERIGAVRGPVAYFYGANDEIIPKKPARKAAAQLPPEARSAYYAKGFHLLLVDHQREAVFADMVAFLKDPGAPFPSGAPPIVAAPESGLVTRAPEA
ncbi:alpha/beta fold hydrolase [Caulobacter sp. NIBR2454]|uniref:alpha/beta fold hydrolase n=1 Tax=Caulobacter sp. NIBR2454 TaxID=3015996 RepID=UPI0022B68372|nr:alpha/beta fold hydrolase [Caulobacter sp. NIBR2454]